jgi:multiple sugar transport system substrate-binding protein
MLPQSHYRAGGQDSLRQNNLAAVLNHLRQRAPISRALLAEITGLNRTTITRMVRDHIEHKFVREVGLQSSNTGRPSILLELNPDAGYIISAQIGANYIAVMCSKLVPDVIWRRHERIRPEMGQQAILDRLLALLSQADAAGRSPPGAAHGAPVVRPFVFAALAVSAALAIRAQGGDRMNPRCQRMGWQVTAVLLIIATLLSACTAAPPQVVVQTAVVTAPPEVQTVVVLATQAAEATAGGAQLDGVTLNPDVSAQIEMWHFWASPVRRNAIRRIIAMCTGNTQAALPNITVVDTVKPFGDIWTANVAAVAAGSGMPDVIISDRPTLPKDAADGIYTSLQEWADRDGVSREQFYDWAWDQTLFEGQTYGIPFETDVRVLFYNKQLFEAAGLDPNDPPDTWDEVWAAADVLDVKNDDGSYARIGFFPLWNAGWEFWMYNNDADPIADDGTPQLNSPNAVETLEWVKTWVDRYGGWQELQNFRAQFGAPPNDIFMSNGMAMFTDIAGYNSQLQFYRPRADTNGDLQITGDDARMDWGIAMLPHDEDADAGNWSGGFSMSIPRGAKNAEAAWEFIKCASATQGQASWARDTYAIPPHNAAASDPVLRADPAWEVIDQALEVSTGGVYVAKYPNWTEQINQRLEQVWLGELSAQEALDQAQQAVEDAIK